MNLEEQSSYNNFAFDGIEDISLPVFSKTQYENRSTEINDTGFNDSNSSRINRREEISSQHVITSQPFRSNANTDSSQPGSRRPIPVSVIDRDHFTNSFHAPVNGLEFMRNVDQLIIQQNCDLADLIADTENRYTVKVPARENTEAIYYATESSKSWQRMCFGSGRAYNMRLYDRTDQEAMSLKRRLACGYCTFCCHLQEVEVWIPPGELVGTISQKWKPFKTSFDICNRHDQVLYTLEGPNSFSCFQKAQMFQIYTSDGSTQIGTIVHQWDPVSVRYQLLLQMPSSITDNRHKALLLGSAFLVEYMFFENYQKTLGLRCIC